VSAAWKGCTNRALLGAVLGYDDDINTTDPAGGSGNRQDGFVSSDVKPAAGAPGNGSRAGAKVRTRTNDPERTKADIIKTATEEFSVKGLAGSRIDEIAEKTRTSKRMIYYYFESKEHLYRAVLEESYQRIRDIESTLDLEHKPPIEALAQLVGFTFDYHMANPDFIRLVMVENIHRGENIVQMPNTRTTSQAVIDTLRVIVEHGQAAGVMRKDLDPVDLHMSISALCFFNVSNRHTFSRIFRLNMGSKPVLKARRESVVEMIVRSVRP
jgi:AcrR family transcriptional regulator